MNLLIEKKFAAAVEVFKGSISLLERDKENLTDKHESSIEHLTLDNSIATLHCNIAVAEYGMGLYRKCIKSCALAIKHDPANLKAYHIEGKAYLTIGKSGHAQATWKEGIDNMTNFSEAETALQIVECLAELKGSGSNSLSATVNSAKASSVSQPTAPVPTSPVDTPPPPPAASIRPPSPPPTVSTVASKPISITSSPSVKESGGAAQAIAALGGKERKVGMEQLQIIENHFIGFRPSQIHPDIIKAASRSVANGSGESTVDNLISMGYLLVNSNKLAEASELFSTLLQYRQDLLAAYLGLGSCWALSGRLEEAVQAFTSAVKLDPKCADAWKRRGQTNAAVDNLDQALLDLKLALHLGSDDEIYFHLGTTYHQKKHYRAALDSLNTYQDKGGEESGKFFNYLGMCNSQLGNVSQALAFFKRAVTMEPSLVEATINRAQMLKESGRGLEADKAFETAIKWFNSNRNSPSLEEGRVDMSRQVFQYRATLQYSMGNYMEALGYLRRYLGDERNSSDDPLEVKDRVHGLVQSALCLQNLGQYSEALNFFDSALKLLPNSTCRVQKHLLLYYLMQIDYNWDEFCVDIDFNQHWKEAFCKYDVFIARHQQPFVVRDSSNDEGEDDGLLEELDASYEVKPELCRIIEISRGLSKWIQLDSPGFLPNSRQHKCFGLAALHMAKKLSQHCELIIQQCDETLSSASAKDNAESDDTRRSQSQGQGLRVLNCGASRKKSEYRNDSDDDEEYHTFAYRDFFDVVVKWRQVSEPNDPVWWIDRLTEKSFSDGFGLHTPMVNGELKCIRYYPYFDMGFALLKKLLTAPGGVYYIARGDRRLELSEPAKKVVSCAATLDDVYDSIGEDFWVVCPCMSSIHKKALLEGTRLTLCKKIADGINSDGVGYDFSIRTPGLPMRWTEMTAELTACFNCIVGQLTILKRMEKMEIATPSSTSIRESTLISLKRESLRLFYYWVNFAPLTRGSAMCGYAALMAVILASNRTISSPIPTGKQLDWDAIFTSSPEEFITKFEHEIETKPSEFSLDNDVDFEEAMPSLYDALQTLHLA